MPHQLDLFFNLAIAFVAALLAGVFARRVGLPPLVGFMLAGVAIGPYTPGPVFEVEQVRQLAELGVIFLMFGLGVEFSLAHLKRVQRLALLGGSAQILGTIGLGALVGWAMGYPPQVAVFFGSVLALSSTMVVLRVLLDRAEVDTGFGRLLIALLIVQDLSVVPMMAILPALGGPSETLIQDVTVAVLKAGGVVGAVLYLGSYAVPRLLHRVALMRSRELFLLATVALALGTAAAAALLGLSLALGAFLAGLVVSESPFTHQILADIFPLRDVFTVLFFVSLGMLLDPSFLLQEPALVALSVAVIVAGKFLLTAAPLALLGATLPEAVRSGLGMVQVGEFSFVLAESGLARGVLPPELYALTLVAALITIPLTPLSMGLGPSAIRLARRVRGGATAVANPEPSADIESARQRWHAVVVGFGELGRSLAYALSRRDLHYLVIDSDPGVIEELRRRKIPFIFGDATNERVLEHAALQRARVFAIAIADPLTAQAVVQAAHRVYPRLDIIARAEHEQVVHLLRESGADEVVHPRFEAGLEMIRHSLHRFGVSSTETLALVRRLREEHYRSRGPGVERQAESED